VTAERAEFLEKLLAQTKYMREGYMMCGYNHDTTIRRVNGLLEILNDEPTDKDRSDQGVSDRLRTS
jgi:aerobic-type carbon monoxide dehydrogenase small subunit (CoxS/CutS family)